MRCGRSNKIHCPNISQRSIQNNNWKPNLPSMSSDSQNSLNEDDDEMVTHKNCTTQTNETPSLKRESSIISINDSDSENTTSSQCDEYGLENLEKEMRLLLDEQMPPSQSQRNAAFKRRGPKPKKQRNVNTKNSFHETTKEATGLA